MIAIVINTKRVHEFEREQGEGEICRVVWREKRKR